MGVGPRTLKLAGAAGTLVVCGASGLAVAIDTKPASAPLKPPVAGASTPAASPDAQTDSNGGLVIPAAGTCAQPAAPARSGARTTPPPVPAELQTAFQQYAQAKTQQQRQQVLAGLTPDQRMQLTAYLQQVAQARQGGKSGGGTGLGLSCLGGSSQGGSQDGSGAPQISANVVAGEPGAPISVSAVS